MHAKPVKILHSVVVGLQRASKHLCGVKEKKCRAAVEEVVEFLFGRYKRGQGGSSFLRNTTLILNTDFLIFRMKRIAWLGIRNPCKAMMLLFANGTTCKESGQGMHYA